MKIFLSHCSSRSILILFFSWDFSMLYLWSSSIWLRTGHLSLLDSFLKLVQKVQMVQRKLVQLKIVTWALLFRFHLEQRTWRLLCWSRYWVSLYFRARRRAYLLSQIKRCTDGFGNFMLFGIDFRKLDALAHWDVGPLSYGSGLDDLFDFFLFYQSVLALDVNYFLFYRFGFFSFTFYNILKRIPSILGFFSRSLSRPYLEMTECLSLNLSMKDLLSFSWLSYGLRLSWGFILLQVNLGVRL